LRYSDLCFADGIVAVDIMPAPNLHALCSQGVNYWPYQVHAVCIDVLWAGIISNLDQYMRQAG
jgi:hypothetical protein